MITQKELKKVLRYDPDKGTFKWLVSNSNRVKPGDIAGSLNKDGYIRIKINGYLYRAHRLAWLYMTASFPSEVDHINHIKDDNSWRNIREVTHQENGRNKSMQRDNASGFVGISWHKMTSKWVAQIGVDGKRKHIGVFSNLSDAVLARLNAEKKHEFHENHGT